MNDKLKELKALGISTPEGRHLPMMKRLWGGCSGSIAGMENKISIFKKEGK